jgi:hypothetical protein
MVLWIFSECFLLSLYSETVNQQTRYLESSTYMPNLPVINQRRDIIAFNGNEVCKTPTHIYHMHVLNTDRN